MKTLLALAALLLGPSLIVLAGAQSANKTLGYLDYPRFPTTTKDYSLSPDAEHAPVWVEKDFGHWDCPAGTKYLFMQTGLDQVVLDGGGYLAKWPLPSGNAYFGYGPSGKKPICLK